MAEKPEDLTLPQASVSRIISDALPPNTMISAEVRKVISKAASVFILYTTATAAGVASKAGRKTMNANDVLEAISDMDFPQFEAPMKAALDHYKKQQTEKKKKSSTSAPKKSVQQSQGEDTPKSKGSSTHNSPKKTGSPGAGTGPSSSSGNVITID